MERLAALGSQISGSKAAWRVWVPRHIDGFQFEKHGDLKNKVVVITGASRGMGQNMGERIARDGATVVILGKTSSPHRTLPGTIHSAAEAIQKAGGKALPIKCDIRKQQDVIRAVDIIKQKYGVIDILINNAAVQYLRNTEQVTVKQFDLQMQINLRGVFLLTKYCLPLLKKAQNPHVLTISPSARRLLPRAARFIKRNRFQHTFSYNFSKVGATLMTLGMAEEYPEIAFNTLWPRTGILTSAITHRYPEDLAKRCLKPEVFSDAAYVIITSKAQSTRGQCFMDNEVLASVGKTDLKEYFVDPTKEWWDLF